MAAATKPNVEGIEALKNFALIPPEGITVDPKINSRRVKAENVDKMVRSYKMRGQDTPVRAVLLPDGSLKLVYGYTRHAAAVKYNKDNPEHPMKLKVEVVKDQDEKAAYISSVVENFQRTDPSPIEIAQQCKSLLEDYGLDLRAVADIFGKPGSDGVDWVTWIQKLLTLPKAARDLVESKQLPTVAAIELVGLDEKDVVAILESAERFGPENRIKGESVRTAAKNKRRESGGTGDGDGATASVKRNAKEVRALLEGLTGPAEDKGVKTITNKILDFWDGKIELDTAERWIRTLGGTIAENKDAKAAVKAAAKAAEEAEAKAKREKEEAAAKAKADKAAAKETAAKAKADAKAKAKADKEAADAKAKADKEAADKAAKAAATPAPAAAPAAPAATAPKGKGKGKGKTAPPPAEPPLGGTTEEPAAEPEPVLE